MPSISPPSLSLTSVQQSEPAALTTAQIAAALLRQETVIDCVVRYRSVNVPSAPPQFLAYVVLSVAFDQAAVQARLQETLGATLAAAVRLISVTRIPLTAEGNVDEAILSKLPLIDATLAQRWSTCLTSQPEVRQAATMVEARPSPLTHLHLADLLPAEQLGLLSAQGEAQSAPPLPRSEPQGEVTSQVPAISHGEPLQPIASMPTNLAQALRQTAQRFPTHGVTYLQNDGTDRVQPYPELLAEAERILGGLQRLNLEPKTKLIFQFDSNQDYIPAFWACMLGGFVPVPIAIAPAYEPDNAVVQKLCNAWQHLDKPIVLTNESVAPGLRSLIQQLGLEAFTLQTIETLQPGGAVLPEGDSSQPEDLAVLLLTSGSTGRPKGVMLTHQNILSNVAASAQVNQFTAQDISLNWLRLDHVGSLVRCCIRDVYVGSQQIHAPAEQVLDNPLRLLDWIERYQVTFAWAPNFALGLINDRAPEIQQRQWNLTSLRSMLSVAEAIVPKTAQRFADLLAPHGFTPEMMHSAWGMSETCAAVTFSHRYLLNLTSPNASSVEVGAPTAGFQMRIVDAQDRVLSEETVGRLQIKGPMVLSGYYQNPELNQSAWTEDGWFKTGDLGYLRQGRLTVTGREKDVIIINGLNHYSHEIEAIAETVDGVAVSYTVAIGIRQPQQDTDLLIIFFSPSEPQADLAELLRKIRGQIIRSIGISLTHVIPVDKSDIPKTSIGKLQRLKLKQQFEAGAFDQQVKQIDLQLENENTIPHWFYEKVWQPKEAVVLTTQPVAGTTLIFLDTLGLGEALKETFLSSNRNCVTVTQGTAFSQLSDGHYQLDPGNPDHYRQLLEALTDRAFIAQIVHLWQYSQATSIDTVDALVSAQEVGLYSLLGLVQALDALQSATGLTTGFTVRLQVVTSRLQATAAAESVAYEKSPMLGIIKTLPKELPWLDCRHLDLPLAPNNETLDENVAHVLRELRVLQLEREVAIRRGRRLIPALKQVNFTEIQPQEIPFKQEGVYLISGGLGGIGVEISKYLLQHYQARLILVGRSPLPERALWQTYLAPSDSELSDLAPSDLERPDSKQTNSKQTEATAARIRTLMSLEALGEVRYEAADIGDLTHLSVLIQQAESDWQRELDGVIHLAGVAPERVLLEETAASLAATLRPKMIGAWVLHQLVKEKADCLFIHFSSALSFFGEATGGSCAAVNSFLDSFSHYQNTEAVHTKTSLQSYRFGSSTGSQVGMNQDYQGNNIRLAQGQIAMSVAQGIQSLLTGLNYGHQQLIFGLDRRDRNIQRHVIAASQPTQQLRAYVILEDQMSLAELQRPTIVDLLGNPSECELIEVSSLSGEVDLETLNSLSGGTQPEPVAPRNPVERQLAEIWQDILDVPLVGIHEDFFDLGGTSLEASRLFLQIEQVFNQLLPLATLFQASTIEQLAAKLTPPDNDGASTNDAESSTDSGLSTDDIWSSLVPIRSEGTKQPLFLVHAGFGDVVGFHSLVKYLEPDRPFYGLRPVDLDGVREPLLTIEEMAAHYVAEILKVHPQGPYLLGGQCTGGIVAYEMAQQLKQQGHEVQLLAMLDTAFPTLNNYWVPRLRYYFHKPLFKRDRKDGWFYAFTAIYLWRKLGYAANYHSRQLCQLKTPDRIAYLKQYAGKAMRAATNKVLPKLNRQLKRTKPLSAQVVSSPKPSGAGGGSAIEGHVSQPVVPVSDSTRNVEAANALMKDRFFETFLRAQAAYRPEPYDGNIDFFLSTDQTYVAIAPPTSLKSFQTDVAVKDPAKLFYGWDQLVGDRFGLHPFKSRHEDMLSSPYIELLAQKLNQAICDRTGADAEME